MKKIQSAIAILVCTLVLTACGGSSSSGTTTATNTTDGTNTGTTGGTNTGTTGGTNTSTSGAASVPVGSYDKRFKNVTLDTGVFDWAYGTINYNANGVPVLSQGSTETDKPYFSKSDKQMLVLYFHIIKLAMNTPKFDEYLKSKEGELINDDGTDLSFDGMIKLLEDVTSEKVRFTAKPSGTTSDFESDINVNGSYKSHTFSNAEYGWNGSAILGSAVDSRAQFNSYFYYPVPNATAANKSYRYKNRIAGYTGDVAVEAGTSTFSYFIPLNIEIGAYPMTSSLPMTDMPKLMAHEFTHNLGFKYHRTEWAVAEAVVAAAFHYHMAPLMSKYAEVENGKVTGVVWPHDITKPYNNPYANGEGQILTDLLIKNVQADFEKLGISSN